MRMGMGFFSWTNLQRQLSEVEALRSIYAGEGEFQLNAQEDATLDFLSNLVEDENVDSVPSISFTINLTSTQVGGRHVSIGFCMPQGYPENQAVAVVVECGGGVTRRLHETLNMSAKEVADSLIGEESILQVLQKVQDVGLEIQAEKSKLAEDSSPSDFMGSKQLVLKRVLIWFHHIKSIQKRKSILEWGRELGLGGYCKPGFPGVLIIEGDGDDVGEYVQRLQRLRWQAMSIRGEEKEDVVPNSPDMASLRRLPAGIREVDENGMSELGSLCREAGIEHLFLSGLKIIR